MARIQIPYSFSYPASGYVAGTSGGSPTVAATFATPVVSAPITIIDKDTTNPATIWQADSPSSSTWTSVVTDAGGNVPGWLDPGSYEITAASVGAFSGASIEFEATMGDGATLLSAAVWAEIAAMIAAAGGGRGPVRQSHSFTVDDDLPPDPLSLALGAFFISPATAETVTLVGAIVHCATVGSIPTTFSVLTDHASHGTLAGVTGLTALTPSTTQSYVTPTGGPYALSNLDRVTVECTNSSTSNSLGCTLTVITEHTRS